MRCCRHLHVAPPSQLRRTKPPPPAIHTVSGDTSLTTRTSDRASSLRLTGDQFAPPSVLRMQVPRSPTIHTVEPLWSTPRSRFGLGTKTGSQLAPPFVVRSTVPASPTAQ